MKLVSRLLSSDGSPGSEPGWDRTASHLDAEGIKVDPVMQMEQADERYFPHIFSKAVEELEDKIGFSLDIPEPVVVDEHPPDLFSEAEFDRERETFLLYSSPDFNPDPETLRKGYQESVWSFLIGELKSELEEPREELLGRHPDYSLPSHLSLDIEEPETGIGSYSSDSLKIRLSPSLFSRLGPDLELKPATDGIDPIGIAVHEFTHAIHYLVNPFMEQLSDHLSSTTQGQQDYHSDVRRASIEDLSQFEGDLQAVESLQEEMEDPFGLAEKLAYRMDTSGDNDSLYNDPYTLGMTEAALVDLALRHEHGDEAGRQMARELMANVATTPRGVEGIIESSLELLGVPNFHEEVERHLQMLESRDPVEGARYEAEQLLPQVREVDAGELGYDGLEAFYSAYGLVTAYNEQVDQGRPEALQELEGQVSSILTENTRH